MYYFRKVVYTLISSPFSCRDFNLGSGGTFATHGFVILPVCKWILVENPFVILCVPH